MHSRRTAEVLLVLTAALALSIPGGCKKSSVTNPQTGPTAAFTAAPRSGLPPLDVYFTDQSAPGTSAITSGTWTFGDGTTGQWPSTGHFYGVTGTYTVSLTVSTAAGTNTATKTNYVTVTNDTVPTPPTAQFSGTPTSGPAPLSVQFTDHSNAGSSPITSRSWTFGDGGNSTATSPLHSYASPGSYTVSLTVTTLLGSNTQTKTGYIQVCGPPVADFTGAPTLGLAPLAVAFANLTTGATSWSWTFGDGGTSTLQNPGTHTYVSTGTYTVRLIAQNACGVDTTTKAGYITATDACSNPPYSVTSASWSNKADADSDGYATRARLTWGTNVGMGCTKSVFARIYSRPQGGTTWTLVTSSPCYSVPGRTVNFSLFIESLPMNCYDFRIAVFECGGTTEKTSRGPADDIDLTNQCFEP